MSKGFFRSSSDVCTWCGKRKEDLSPNENIVCKGSKNHPLYLCPSCAKRYDEMMNKMKKNESTTFSTFIIEDINTVIQVKYTVSIINLYELYLKLKYSDTSSTSLDYKKIGDKEIEVYVGNKYFGKIKDKGNYFEIDKDLLQNINIERVISGMKK